MQSGRRAARRAETGRAGAALAAAAALHAAVVVRRRARRRGIVPDARHEPHEADQGKKREPPHPVTIAATGRATSLDGDGLREVARLVDVGALQVGHVICKQLQRQHREERQHLRVRLRDLDDVALGDRAVRMGPARRERRLCGAEPLDVVVTLGADGDELAFAKDLSTRISR